MVRDYILIAVVILLAGVIAVLGSGDITSWISVDGENVNEDVEGVDGVNSVNQILIDEDGFNHQEVSLHEGDFLKVENRDSKAHRIWIDGLNRNELVVPNASFDVKVETGEYKIESSEFDNKSVHLDVNEDLSEKTRVGSSEDTLYIHDDGFSYSRIEMTGGKSLTVENRDNRTHTVTISALNVERELSPGDTTEIEVKDRDYRLESSEFSDKTVYLDIN